MLTRRHFIGATVPATGATVFLPYAANAAARASDLFETANGQITIHPVDLASFVMETPNLTI
jgi:hypothetical protein